MIRKVYQFLNFHLNVMLRFVKKIRNVFKQPSKVYKLAYKFITVILIRVGIMKDTQFYISTSDLYYLQNHKSNSNDIIDAMVRILAIEHHYGKNNIGFEIYNKMQLKRVNGDWESRFKELMISFERKYDSNYPIKLRENFNISDGSHRFALAIYHNIDYVKVEHDRYSKGKRNYSIDWFYENGFSIETIKKIKEKNRFIEERLKYEFVAILWPPAELFFDEIIKDINSLEDVIITKQRDLHLDDHYDFVRAIYKTDDISKENIEKK